jgi:steroid 5-alpha reductase family enzyme
MAQIFLTAAAVLLLYMTTVFLLAIKLRDNSIVDIAYGGAFIVTVSIVAIFHGVSHPRFFLLYAMVAVWGLRLVVHLLFRHRGRGEDFRYQKWREEWGDTFLIRSFFQIYVLQGTVILVIATPLLYTVAYPGGPLGFIELAGLILWAVGFTFEAVGDRQLLVFKADLSNKGKIITTGLWRYTRHPNYFGECTLWWGVYLVSLGSPGAWWTVISPLTINFLLLYVSGIPMLEKKYEGDPVFQEYKRRTSPLIPWFPRS